MSGLLRDIDPEGLLEYSVVFTDRSLNHMSGQFQQVMRDIAASMKAVYQAAGVVVVPVGGTYAMESVARQFATGQKCLILRNGWFSFRWTQILEMGAMSQQCTVMCARPTEEGSQASFEPAPLDEVTRWIKKERPGIVFAPHVETSAGMMLPDAYLRAVSDAVHEVGGLFVLDCIASGCVWVDMRKAGIDVLISAPQKGWSASPCSGLVMLSSEALKRFESTTSTSFACDLRKWLEIMRAYESGGHAYHATMPTDALKQFRDTVQETEEYGFGRVMEQQLELGGKVRALLGSKGFKSVAAPGYEAPGVVVCYTDDPDIHNGSKFAAQGMQIAAGVPLKCGEPADYQTFRIGLFGLDKLHHIDRTVASLEQVLEQL